MREGAQVSGLPAGVNFAGPISDTYSSSGPLAVNTGLSGSGINKSNDAGMWMGQAGALTNVIRAGDHAPGMPDGTNFGEPTFVPSLNSAGQMATRIDLAGSAVDSSNQDSIWTTVGGTLSLVARRGSQAAVRSSWRHLWIHEQSEN